MVRSDLGEQIKAKSFTIDGEAVVLGPDGLSRSEELSRREGARTAILYALDLIEHDGEDMRNRRLIAEDDVIVFAHACPLGAEGNFQASRRHLSIRSLSGLDQGPRSRRHRGAAGKKQDLESMSLRQRTPSPQRNTSVPGRDGKMTDYARL
jgi:hypothetical protein